MPLTDMGILNGEWGICGVTGSLYSLHVHSPGLKGKLAKTAKTDTMMVEMIAWYLTKLKADGAMDMWTEIEAFTRSFEGFEGFSLDAYHKKANLAGDGMPGAIYGKAHTDFSIALPPDAVVDFLRRICGFRNARVAWQANLLSQDATPHLIPGKEYIVGVIDTDMKLYGGLCHYVYQAANGKVHSWGNVYDSVGEAGDGWGICTLISPSG